MQSETEQREKLDYENRLLAARVGKFQTIISRELKQSTKENETLRREVCFYLFNLFNFNLLFCYIYFYYFFHIFFI